MGVGMRTGMRTHGNPRRDYASEWKWWRKSHRMTKVQLATALGIDRRTIFNIESGRHTPCLGTREKLQALQNKYQEARSWKNETGD